MTDERDLNCSDIPIEVLLSADPDPAEGAELLSHLETCPTCRERLRVMLGLEVLLERQGDRRWLGIPSRFHLQAAAVLLAASLGSALFLRLPSPADSGPLRVRPPRPPFPLLTRGSGLRQAPVEAFEAYRQGRYGEAEATLAGYPGDPNASFYRAICLVLLGRPLAARDLLSTLTDPSSELRYDALWFLAQIHLQQGEQESARKALKQIDSGSRYREPARRLLQHLAGEPSR